MIGRIANAWAQLEFEIDRGIWDLIGAPQPLTACVTSQMFSIHPRMRAFIALVEVRGGSTDTLAALKKFSDKHVSGLVEPRNRAVHDPRMLDRDTGQVHRLDVTARPKVHFGFKAES